MLIHKQIPYINITFKLQCMDDKMYLWWHKQTGGARGSERMERGRERGSDDTRHNENRKKESATRNSKWRLGHGGIFKN